MVFDPIAAIRMDVFSVALKAKCNDLPRQDVDLMMTRAEEALASDDALFRAVTEFAVQFEVTRFDRDALRSIGEELERALQRYLRPDLVDAARRDIHG